MRAAVLLVAVLVLAACSAAPKSYWNLQDDEGALRTGMSVEDVEDRIGPANEDESVGETGERRTWLYSDPATPTLRASLTVWFEDGRVTRWETAQGE